MAFFSDHCLLLLIIGKNGECKRWPQNCGYLSPQFEMDSGSVSVQLFHNIDFPKGHIAIESFDAELVDKTGKSMLLHETYLLHWIIIRYYQSKNASMIIRNDNSVCEDDLPQYFGLGSEIRIKAENPTELPEGYEEGWTLELYAIDTRRAEDKMGCTEGRCDLYNVEKVWKMDT